MLVNHVVMTTLTSATEARTGSSYCTYSTCRWPPGHDRGPTRLLAPCCPLGGEAREGRGRFSGPPACKTFLGEARKAIPDLPEKERKKEKKKVRHQGEGAFSHLPQSVVDHLLRWADFTYRHLSGPSKASWAS